MNIVWNFVKKHAVTICSILATGGVVATGVLSSIATKNAIAKVQVAKSESAEELTAKDAVKLVWPCYIWPLAAGAATTAAIFTARGVGMRQQAVLMAASGAVASAFNEYKGKVVELYGPEAHEYIVRELKAAHADDPYISYPSMFECHTENIDQRLETQHTFYEPISGKLFEATWSQVLLAQLHINRNLSLRGDANVTEYWAFLGISHLISESDKDEIAKRYNVASVDELYWCVQDELYVIDIAHDRIDFAGGVEVYRLEPAWEPSNYEDLDVYMPTE